jgi:hemerythrin-like domain-containing protein
MISAERHIMLPVEVLVNEHQLILYTVGVLKKGQQKISATGKVDPNFIVVGVDFFRTYADRYHHGKEEGILFNALFKTKLSDADSAMMRELILEHATARRTVTSLENLKTGYIGGKTEALGSILDALDVLIELYPRHIEKEDKHFFIPVMQYFTEKEQQEMLQKFLEYDQNFTDNRYKQTIETLEKGI